MNQTKYKICKLNEVAWFQEGPGVRKSQFRTSGVKLLNVGNICDRELVLDKTSIYISEEEAYGKYKHFLVDEGDLLIASSGIKVDYFDKKITFARKEHLPLCMNTSTIRFKVLDKTQLDIHYLRHFLASRYFTKQVQFYITGSAQLNFGPSHLNKMTIILPPLEEQKKIAKILDKADEIRAKKKLANDKLDEFLKSTFISMFGDKSYEKVTIGSVTDNTVQTNPSKIYEDMFYYVDIASINNEKCSIVEPKYLNVADAPSRARKRINKDDVLVSTVRPYLRGFAIVPECLDNQIASTGFSVLRAKQEVLSPLYLFSYIKSEEFISQLLPKMEGASYPAVRDEDVRNVVFKLPPIEDQNKFAQIVEHVEAQKQKNELVIEQMDNLFNSLSQRAFKGEL